MRSARERSLAAPQEHACDVLRERLSHDVETTNAPPAHARTAAGLPRPGETHGRVSLLEHAAKLQALLVELGDEPLRIDVGARRARALQASLAQRR
jgi:hypothetical protein